MDWYYAQDGQQKGPVSDVEFAGLVTGGVITDQTLVWHEGLANWQPHGGLKAGLPPPPAAPPVDQPQAGANEVVCAECGRIFPKDQAVLFGAAWVCAGCKPVFVQKLKEGVASTAAGPLRFAGFWIRVAAKLIDGLLLTVVLVLPLAFLVGMITARAQRADEFSWALIGMQVVLQIAYVGVTVAYNTFMIGKYGATLGKMAVGIRVVTADGASPTMKRAFGRAWGEQLSGLTCNIGYLIAAFDEQKRALHDHICNTRVIYK